MAAINGLYATWTPVVHGAPQGSFLEPVLLDSIYHTEKEMEHLH